MKRKEVGIRGQEPEGKARGNALSVLCSALVIFCFVVPAYHLLFSQCLSYAQDNTAASVDKRQKELKDKEDSLKQREERFTVLKKDVEDKIEQYTKILSQVEAALKKIESVREEKVEHLVKTYEAMPPEDAALRLSALEEQTAVRILSRMKNKKAAAVMASMEPRKVASLTDGMLKIEKKFPSK